ncbi:MAG TPA: hypothetical protein VKA70_16450 [Blastocatellia bacterium]|nr:hypothetical protein [Blastocatellia bacterium]
MPRAKNATKDQPEPKDTNKSVPIILAIIGAVTSILIGYWQFVYKTPAPSPTRFTLSVMIEDKKTRQVLKNAKVVIVSGQSPLIEITNDEGYARFELDNAYLEKPARLKAEASGYSAYEGAIDLRPDPLPRVIQLSPLNLE